MSDLLRRPNVSVAGDAAVIGRFEEAFGSSARVLDVHTDADHGRTVFTLAGEPGPLTEALVAGAEEALESIDMSSYTGMHPAIGALDVCPVVCCARGSWRRPHRGVAVAGQIGALGVPASARQLSIKEDRDADPRSGPPRDRLGAGGATILLAQPDDRADVERPIAGCIPVYEDMSIDSSASSHPRRALRSAAPARPPR